MTRHAIEKTKSPKAAKNRQYPAPKSWLMYSLA